MVKRDCDRCKTRHGGPIGNGCKRTKHAASPGGSKHHDDDDMTAVELVAALRAQNKLLRLENEELQAEKDLQDDDADSNSLTATLKMLTTEMASMKSELTELKSRSRDPSPAKSDAGGTPGDKNGVLMEQLKLLLGLTESAPKRSSGATSTIADLEQFVKGKALKSGKDLSSIHNIVNEVPWPHMRVYDDPDEDKETKYSDLTIEEFMYGYFMQARETTDVTLQNHLYSHLELLLEDIKDYPDEWDSIRSFHHKVLRNIEHGKFSWDSEEKIQRLRAKHVWGSKKLGKKKPCPDYNKGKCSYTWDHKSFKHMCAYCWGIGKGRITHAQTECRRLQTDKKGDEKK